MDFKINSFLYDEIQVGFIQTFNTVVDNEKVEGFRSISGDINPLHNDENYAISKGFKGKVAYGMLTASFYSTLVGVFLPGEKCLIHSMELKFNNPVYLNDILCIKGEVVEKNDTCKLITIKGKIKNQNGVIVSKAMIKVGVLE